jgi:2EXR family
MSDYCPFFRLPLELRNKIYPKVLPEGSVIYAEYSTEDRGHLLKGFPEEKIPRDVYLLSGVARKHSALLDTTMFFVCNEARQEVLSLLFANYRLLFRSSIWLNNFCRTFRPYSRLIQAVETFETLEDVP